MVVFGGQMIEIAEQEEGKVTSACWQYLFPTKELERISNLPEPRYSHTLYHKQGQENVRIIGGKDKNK